MRLVLLGFVAAVVLISYREIHDAGRAPAPSRFLGSAGVYGIAGVLAELAPGLGGVLAIGWTLGLLFGIVGKASAPTPYGEQPGPARKIERMARTT